MKKETKERLGRIFHPILIWFVLLTVLYLAQCLSGAYPSLCSQFSRKCEEMKCPKHNESLGVVWVAKPESKNSIYQLDDVQFCWECGMFYLAKPELIEVQSSVTSPKKEVK